MRPTKKFSVWLAAIALLVAMVLTPIAAGAKPPASKVWNIYQDKLGAYSVTSAVPKGQTFIEGPFTTQAEATAALTQPPVIDYTLNPASPNGANGWYSSGNIGLTWNVFVPGSPGKSLVVTGDGNKTVSTDGTFTFTKSATAVGGSVGPVNVTIKRDVTDPALNLGTSIVNNDSFEVGSVPAEPTFNPQDATSGLDSSSLTGYDVAVGAHTLIATATDLAGNMIQQQVGYTVTPHQAQVLAPVAADETFNSPGVANPGSITIPTVAGVDYFIDGVLVSGGANPLFAGNYRVTAAPQSQDYEMVGYPSGGWALTIAAADVTVPVTTQAPVAFDETANLSGGITIPQVTGVNYFIDGNPASAGDNLLPNGAHLVTAEAQPFYVLNGDVSWNLTINAYVPPIIEVTAMAPTATDQTANASGFITIPLSEGVDYALDAAPVAAGNHNVAPGPHAVLATPQAGYALLGQTSWNLTVNAYVNPVVIDMTGVTYPSGAPNAAKEPITVMRDPYQSVEPWVQNGPPMQVDEATDTISFTVPVNTPNTPLGGDPFSGYHPNIAVAIYGTLTNVPANVDVFATMTLSPSLAGQESKFKLSFISTVYMRPVTVVTPQPVPVTNLNLEATNWGAAVGGHDYQMPGVGAQWTGVTGTGSVTVTMHFTAAAL